MKSWFKADVLDGKTAFVVGGSSESGPAVCRVLSDHGARVAFTYKKQKEKARSLEEELTLRNKAKAYQFDLLDIVQVFDLIPKVVQDFDKLDVLVNLGGPAPVYSDLRDIGKDDFDRMIDSHFKGYFFLAREAGVHMESFEGGVIVNVSATSSKKYSHGAYGLAKACVPEMTKFLAYTFAPTVRIYTLIPGLIDIEEVNPELRTKRAKDSPLKRNVTPEELSQLIISVCSPSFQSVTVEKILLLMQVTGFCTGNRNISKP